MGRFAKGRRRLHGGLNINRKGPRCFPCVPLVNGGLCPDPTYQCFFRMRLGHAQSFLRIGAGGDDTRRAPCRCRALRRRRSDAPRQPANFGPAWVSPAGSATGVLVVISLIVADFRAGKRTVLGAYCDLWMIPQSSYIPIRIRELGTGNCCSEAKGLPMANPPTRKKLPTRRLGRL
jgi:hypothetical protein